MSDILSVLMSVFHWYRFMIRACFECIDVLDVIDITIHFVLNIVKAIYLLDCLCNAVIYSHATESLLPCAQRHILATNN